MNIGGLDLNLLRAFDAVYRHRSVSRAAGALGVPQPTLSNALHRLRAALGDALFVRTQGGMNPTPFADGIAADIRDGLDALARGLARRAGFDPARERREFTLIMIDMAEAVILPPLLEACRRHAPSVTFRTVQLGERETRAALEAGKVDLAIGFFPALKGGAHQQTLFETEYVCIAGARSGAGHGAGASGGTLSRSAFRTARFVVADAQGTGHDTVERALERAGLGGRIAVRVPHFLALPMIVAHTDLLATVPRPLGHILRGAADIRLYRHPLALPRLRIRQVWHERFHRDPANRWLRAVLRDVFAKVDWGE